MRELAGQRVVDDDVLSRDLDVALAVQVADHPRHRLPGCPDHVRDLLVSGAPESDAAVLAPAPALARHLEENSSDATVDVVEGEVSDLLVGLSKPRRENGEEVQEHAGALLHDG